jgi:tRNA(Ile2) C34 agmatinyltransferase TiaS
MSEQSPICEKCGSWLLSHPELLGWLKCNSCGYCVKVKKRIITIVGWSIC